MSDVYLVSIDDLQQLIDEIDSAASWPPTTARTLLGQEVARFLARSRAH